MGSSDSKLNVLLAGRAGNGKSSTGNSFVGDSLFSAFGDTNAVTRRAKKIEISLFGKEVTVVDTPGLMDNWMEEIESCYFARRIMEDAFKICKEGFHSILIVLSYSNRFSAEEQKVIEMLKEIFGQSLLQFAILIFTHGDNFDKDFNVSDSEESQASFLQWCSQLKGDLKDLLEACNHRAVLFHNNHDYTGNREVEKRALQRHTESIKVSKKVYTQWHFDAARKSRERLVLTTYLGPLKVKILDELATLKHEFHLITNQEKTLFGDADELLKDLNPSTYTKFSTICSAVDDIKKKFSDKETNKTKRDLLLRVKAAINVRSIYKLQRFVGDLDTLLNPEKSKLNLKRKIRELLQCVTEEAHDTGLLDEEIRNVKSFQREVEDYDTRQTIVTEMLNKP